MKSKFLKVNVKDFIRSIIIITGTSSTNVLLNIFQDNRIPTVEELRSAAIVGLCAGAVYLLKNIFTNSNDKFGPE